MDELAAKMEMDPLELRAKNVYRKGDTTPTGQAPEVYSFPEMIDKLRPLYKAARRKPARNPPLRSKRELASASASTAAESTAPTPPRSRWN